MAAFLLLIPTIATVAASSFDSLLSSNSQAYFDYETVQLLPSDLHKLSPPDAALFGFNSTTPINRSCKVFPGADAWPSDDTWSLLNQLIGGALIKAVPRASTCYSGPDYDAADCEYLTSQWTNSYFHADDPIEMLSPVYQGLTCQPTNDTDASCTLGGYPHFVINATNVAQIQLGINFARNTGVRLVVKNTGHDMSGKSGGAGSLSIFTHNFKDIRYIESYDASETDWNGAAFKVGAGVQAFELYKAAHEHGLMVVGGEGQTVGLMGGYVLGGGHSPLSSILGLGADQVLSMEIVTPDGRFLTIKSFSGLFEEAAAARLGLSRR